ncbi:hypothetical protein NO2_1591, partial [Candidatus Termititenax persephonae]
HVTAATAATKADITALGIPGSDTTYAHPTATEYGSGLYKVTVDGLGHVTAATAATKADITALGIPGSDTNTTYSAATSGADGLMSAADKAKLDGILTEVKLLIGNFNSVVTGYTCDAKQNDGHASMTWYAAIRYCIEKTPANLRGRFTTSCSDSDCINYQYHAVRTPGAYRLLTDAEWLDARHTGKITDTTSGTWEWCGDLSSYFYDGGDNYRLRRVFRMPSSPTYLSAGDATSAHAIRLARTV